MDFPAEAEANYRRLTELDPDSPVSHFVLGRFFLQQKKFSEAVPCFQKCVALDANFLMGYLLLGQALERRADRGDNREAKAAYERGLERAKSCNDSQFSAQLRALLLTAE